ncbi:MAG TPA: HAD-IC family P-type ATPase [Desulfuromonadales bacterium]|nr:HAD-IC family P-type ATPase [Desulfuromonadales bacterium]
MGKLTTPTDDIKWHTLTDHDVLTELGSAATGLEDAEAAARLLNYGTNTLARAAGDGPWLIFWRQIHTPIGWLLIAAGFMAVLLGKYTDSTVVFGAVLVNAVIGFLQEYRAGKAIDALSALVPRVAIVMRTGLSREIRAEDLVPGDVVTLQSGDQTPADLRFLQVKNLLVDEAALTGESLPVAKRGDPVPADAALGDRFCMAYSGTLVVQGTATAVVVATGAATELGKINALLDQATQLETPLTRQLEKVTLWITVAVIAMVVVLVAFGILVKNAPIADALMVAVSLAAAAIPEGLPSVITIALAIGVRRMASRHAVVRHLPAVETLGSTSVICSDKTGTLTRNEMTVQAAWCEGKEFRIAGVGYAPFGEIEHDGQRLAAVPPGLQELLTVALLCNDAALRQDGELWAVSGDPTEAAMVVAGRKAGLDEIELRAGHERLDAIPFESDIKYMATLNRFAGGSRILLKGAPETVLDRCELADEMRRRAIEAMETYGRQGMRVIAFASGEAGGSRQLSAADVGSGLTFAGLVGMIDPPRSEALDAIRICHSAGITVKMITGDHPTTAEAIGRQLGLLSAAQSPVTGRQLEGLSDEEVQKIVSSTNVFARVAPEHKIRLVVALQNLGHVVAMTGDGVNDAPALKQADIGVAMGITGTAVSKEAAKVILVDDNFASIAAAVEEGRRVYDNLIKSLAFILPTNLGLAFTLSAAMFFFPTVEIDGVRILLLAMSPGQTLWINLIASVTLSVPLAFEVLEPNAMARPPRSPDAPVFSGFIVMRLIVVATLMAAAACGLFLMEYFRIAGSGPIPAGIHAVALAEAQTSCVTAVTFSQIFYLLNCRSLRNSFLSQGIFSNPSIYIGIAVLLLLQACFVYVPFLQVLFGTTALDTEAWFHAALAGALVLPVISCEKWIRGRFI